MLCCTGYLYEAEKSVKWKIGDTMADKLLSDFTETSTIVE